MGRLQRISSSGITLNVKVDVNRTAEHGYHPHLVFDPYRFFGAQPDQTRESGGQIPSFYARLCHRTGRLRGDCSSLRREPSLTLADAVPPGPSITIELEGWKTCVIGHILEHKNTMND